MRIQYEYDISVTDYNRLRASVDWGMLPEQQANDHTGSGMTQWHRREV